jgi:hypothetical protein
MELGDQVVYKDGKDGRRYDAKIVGFDGPNAILKRGNMDRKAPIAELLPSFATRQEIPEVEDETSRMSTSDSDTSDTEIIDEIRPRRRGPIRKRKPEIIPEISEKKVVRTSKRRAAASALLEDTDDEITLERWSEDEDQSIYIKNLSLTKPKLFCHIRAWNTYGEEFSGEVIDLKPETKTIFKLREHQTSAEICVDLNKINQWIYIDEPKLDKIDKSGGASLRRILHAATKETEEFANYKAYYITPFENVHYYEYG